MQIDHFASAILGRLSIFSWRMASYILDDALVSTREGELDYFPIFNQSDLPVI
jgi:hypothetical protein